MKNKYLNLSIGLSLLVASAHNLQAASVILNTPAGLAEGTQFRFVFVTPGTRDATSTSISDYNSFVNTQAGGAMFNDTIVNWYAIASTSAVNAKNNIAGLQTTPIYLASGTKVTNDLSATAGGLWGVYATSTPLLSPINYTLTGPVGTPREIWTGADNTGTSYGSSFALGGSSPLTGFSAGADSQWVEFQVGSFGNALSLYGISEVLTAQASAVPEPGSLVSLAALLSSAALIRTRRKATATA